MKLIFISDLHLGADTPTKNELFYSLLQKWCSNIDALYILGDFFDYWLGDDDKSVFHDEIITKLALFTRHTPIYFIVGNHDFALGRHFALQTGVKFLKDPSIISINSKRVMLSHGDIFCTEDISYQRTKKIMRNPLTMFILRKLPLYFRRQLKVLLKSKSKKPNNKPKSTYQVVDSSIIKMAAKLQVSTIIHGHTHNPGLYTILTPTGELFRYEIPDWENTPPGGYISLDNGDIAICSPRA